MNYLTNVIGTMMQNKNTSVAALIFFLLSAAGIIWPEYKPKLDEISKLAVFYGLIAAGDAKSNPGAAPAKDSVKLPLALAACFVWLSFICSGCAYVHSVTYDPTNGKRQTSATAYTLFDANSQLAKFRNTSATTTNGQWGAGTSVTGLEQSSATTTNFNELVGTVVQAAVVGGIKGAKP
jgi:hypothetical protein